MLALSLFAVLQRKGEPMSAVNVELLTRTLDYIVAHPKEWNQRDWRCGTAACFAGNAALLAGWQWIMPFGDPDQYLMSRRLADGRCSTIAQSELGLTEDEAGWLFDGRNTLDDLIQMVESVAVIAEIDPEAVA